MVRDSENDYTKAWSQFEAGKDYNRKLDYYNIVDINERMYAGDQWRGVKSNGLSTPVFNIFKRIINFFIASILNQPAKLTFIPELIAENSEAEEEKEINRFIDFLNKNYEVLWENLKMYEKTKQLLLDASLSGDMVVYSFWDSTVDTGQEVLGEISTEVVDGTNVYFGNPNNRCVEKQPYIIISFRESVKELKAEAKKYKVKESDISKITSDEDNLEQAGDRGKIELEKNSGSDDSKATVILKFWKEDGVVYAEKSSKFVVIRPKWNTKLTRYPIALNNWDVRKNSYHGQALGTGIVPNQIYINKMFAMIMVFMQQMAFPKLVYDTTKISAISNKIGAAIGVQGDTNGALHSVSPPQMSNQVMQSIDNAIVYTKEMLGASDAFMGNIYPENTSAILVTQKQAAIPLESVKQNLYQLIEDLGYQWIDFMANYYGKRKITYVQDGKRQVIELDFDRLKKIKLKVKVEVGASNYWSEITAAQTLENLLQQEKITFIEYLERLPNGIVPNKQKLIEARTDETEETFKFLMLEQFLQANPEVMQQLQGLEEEEQEKELMRIAVEMLSQQAPPQGQQQIM